MPAATLFGFIKPYFHIMLFFGDHHRALPAIISGGESKGTYIWLC